MNADSSSPWNWKGISNNFQRKDQNKFSLPNIFDANRRKPNEPILVLEAGGGAGVGCGVGLGFGLVGAGGIGLGGNLHLVFGLGLGCGVGLGLGIGQGIGYGFSFESLHSYFSDDNSDSKHRPLIQV